MSAYIFRRLLLMIPTLLGIMLLNFIIVQAAPGGPVERMLAQIQGIDSDVQSRLGGSSSEVSSGNSSSMGSSGSSSKYRGAQGLDPELVARIEKLYGFDKPAYERFFIMIKNYAVFDFGESFLRDKQVTELVLEKR
jgi:microcin C transport system permease protein